MDKICFYCSQPSTFKCSKCLTIQYCSQECQKKDWKVHKKNCDDNNKDDETSIETLQSKAASYYKQLCQS